MKKEEYNKIKAGDFVICKKTHYYGELPVEFMGVVKHEGKYLVVDTDGIQNDTVVRSNILKVIRLSKKRAYSRKKGIRGSRII